MTVEIKYDTTDKVFNIPLSFLAVELGLDNEQLVAAVKRLVEKY